MAISEDIEQVINELGPLVVVYDHNTQTSNEEHIDYNRDVRATTPFDSSFFIECDLPYNSTAKPGDKITFQATNENYLLATLDTEIFEASVVVKEGVLYKCNTTIEVQEKSGERNSDYVMETVWNPVFSGEHALFTGTLSEQNINDERYARIYSKTRSLFASIDLPIEQEHRCLVNGEAYRVDLVEPDRLPGLKICSLSLDNRE